MTLRRRDAEPPPAGSGSARAVGERGLRVDNYLKISRLVRKRSLVRRLCKAGAITVNGAKAKAGKEVKKGDLIAIDLWSRSMTVEVVFLPRGNIPGSEARGLYRVLEEREKSQQIEW